jgi:hypothetical protein
MRQRRHGAFDACERAISSASESRRLAAMKSSMGRRFRGI